MSTRCLPPALLAAVLAAPAARPQDAIDRELLKGYFATCDADGNGWLSFRECRDSLSLDRAGFAEFDRDLDLRVSVEEFEANYDLVARRAGAILVPVAADRAKLDPPRSSKSILATFDRNGDGALQKSELAALFEAHGRKDLPIDTALDNLDVDGNDSLSGAELERASRLLVSLSTSARPSGDPAALYGSLDQLFGRVVERPAAIDASRQPPLIVGPVLPFRRLDLDADGGIEIDDLYRLMTPVTPSFSIGAIHAGLDPDEDGRIDRAELALALGLTGAGR
jgi:Ca2+-binding EF-hand superfamily protein